MSSHASLAMVLEGITKRFRSTVAVDDVHLELAPHELLALVGPSGCGKSTLLRVIAGLLEADAGRVTLADALVDDGNRHVPPEGRHVGIVFQDHALFPHLTVGRNIAFGIRDVSRAETRDRVSEILDLVGLGSLRERYPHELSGGERQRVALARALAPRPTLLLLDEPFASLDPNLRKRIRTDVVDILRATGTPAVFVTHDQAEAMAVGDRVAVMRAGRVEQVADAWAVFHQPVNTFVAGFMGEASFLDVRALPDGAETDLGPLPLRPPDSIDGMVAMVRPDDLTFAPDPDGDAQITAAEFRGSMWCYTVRLSSGVDVLAAASHLDSTAVGARGRLLLTPGHEPVLVTDSD